MYFDKDIEKMIDKLDLGLLKHKYLSSKTIRSIISKSKNR